MWVTTSNVLATEMVDEKLDGGQKYHVPTHYHNPITLESETLKRTYQFGSSAVQLCRAASYPIKLYSCYTTLQQPPISCNLLQLPSFSTEHFLLYFFSFFYVLSLCSLFSLILFCYFGQFMPLVTLFGFFFSILYSLSSGSVISFSSLQFGQCFFLYNSPLF